MAPKELLGDFPRMTRAEAANAIFQTEAKNKGWITEGPDAVKPPKVEEDSEKMETDDSAPAGDQVKAPSHIKLDPIQEKLFNATHGAGLAGSARWGSQVDNGGGDAPLAVQQAMAMVGRVSWRRIPHYLLAQYLGALLGGALVFLIYWDALAWYEHHHGSYR